MQVQVLNIKTTYELFPNCYALLSLEDNNGNETLYTFQFEISEYEEFVEEQTEESQYGLIERLEETSITQKEEVIQYFNDKIEELGVFEFINDYNLELYKDPTQVHCKQGNFGKNRNKWIEYNALLRSYLKKDLFVIKEEFGGKVVFLYS